MAVSREEVLAVARLARLRLSDREAELMTAQLNDILGHMRALDELDVTGVQPLAGAAEGGAPLRAEDATPDPLQLPVSQLGADWVEGFFTVPRLPALDTAEPDELG